MRVMDILDFVRYLSALLLVLGLIGVAGLAARRFGLPGLTKSSATRRLRIVETLMISPRQRFVIVRRDDVEHLVMIGPEGASLIEPSITPPAPPSATAAAGSSL